MSYMGNSISVATIYSPVLGFWLLSHFGFPYSFVYSGIMGLLGAVLAIMISSKRSRFPDEDVSGGKVPLVSRAALFPAFVFLTYTLTTAPVNTFLPLLAEDRNLGNPGLYFSVFSATTILAMFISGPVADRFGRPAVITPGLLLAAAAMFLLMAASNQLMLLGAGFFAGFGFGLLQPGMQSLTVDRVPPRERGSAMATLQQAWDFGGSGGAFVLGPVAGVVGVAATFGVVGVGALAGAVGFVFGNAKSPAVLPTSQESSPAADD
jgi:MFS family permease